MVSDTTIGSSDNQPKDELVLRQIIVQGISLRAQVKRWDESPTIAWVRKREHVEHIELVHLLIMPNIALMTLDEFRELGYTRGDLVGFAERNISALASEFIPSLGVGDLRYMCFLHDEHEIIGPFYIGVLMGHRGLFEKYLLHVTDPVIRPGLVEAETREHSRKIFLGKYEND